MLRVYLHCFLTVRFWQYRDLQVRLHMQHNHKDNQSQPMNVFTQEMQDQWDSLMEQCFPGYLKVTYCIQFTVFSSDTL